MARRATRERLRRRTPLRRNRAELCAPVPHTTSQYPLPEVGQKMADKATRAGVAERCEAVAEHKTRAVDRTLITSYPQLRNDLALCILTTAQPHDAHTLSL